MLANGMGGSLVALAWNAPQAGGADSSFRREWKPEQESLQDSLPEWSKGVDSGSTSASCVGSNPTAVNSTHCLRAKSAVPHTCGGFNSKGACACVPFFPQWGVCEWAQLQVSPTMLNPTARSFGIHSREHIKHGARNCCATEVGALGVGYIISLAA